MRSGSFIRLAVILWKFTNFKLFRLNILINELIYNYNLKLL